MSACEFLTEEAKAVWDNYQPLITEASGFSDLAYGVTFFALSLLLKLDRSSDDPRTLPVGALTSSQVMQLSRQEMALGVLKLFVPISISTGYFTYRMLS